MKKVPFIAACGVLAASAVQASSAGSPQSFLRGLYAQYTSGGRPTPLTYPHAARIVDSTMLAMLRRDSEMSKGDLGAIEADPICQCQDWGPFEVLSVRAEQTGPDRARGDVTFSNGPGRHLETTRFDLIRSGGRWKIYDIGTRAIPSFLTYLRNFKY